MSGILVRKPFLVAVKPVPVAGYFRQDLFHLPSPRVQCPRPSLLVRPYGAEMGIADSQEPSFVETATRARFINRAMSAKTAIGRPLSAGCCIASNRRIALNL
jgi:hypothetical protein